MEGPGEQELLRQYLAGHDAACPDCGYNLRGAVGEKCPECARPMALGIVRSGSASALTWFLLLAFGWVFAAGAMNSVRNWRSITVYVDSQLWGSTYVLRGRPDPSALLSTLAPADSGGFWSTAWQVVPAYTWAGAAWSFGLVLGCGIGLLLMAHRRTSPFGAKGERRMVVLACSMFAVYAAWHITNFVLEFT